jgi:uncharacterized protein
MAPSDEVEQSSFLGIGWGFPPSFSKASKGVEMRSDEDDIENSLRILLTTTVGERFLQPEYGCHMHEMVFESLTTTMITELQGFIEQAILHFEPRIDLNDVRVNSDDALHGKTVFLIDYTIRTTNSRHNLVFPYYLEHGISTL